MRRAHDSSAALEGDATLTAGPEGRQENIARRLGVSPGHLNVLCHEHLGRPASDEIHQRLLLEAKRMLRYSDKAAFAIAQELGFADPAYFGRFFRRGAGLTPRRYRQS